jgi:hypothetical protein
MLIYHDKTFEEKLPIFSFQIGQNGQKNLLIMTSNRVENNTMAKMRWKSSVANVCVTVCVQLFLNSIGLSDIAFSKFRSRLPDFYWYNLPKREKSTE